MKLPQTGGCQCGALRYEITQAPQLVATCHCTDCQRMTSSAFSIALVLRSGTFRLVRGDPKAVQRLADSGRMTTRWSARSAARGSAAAYDLTRRRATYGAALWTIPPGCGRPCTFGLAANSPGSFCPRAVETLRRSPQGTPGGPPLFNQLSLSSSGVNRFTGALARFTQGGWR
jgi:hypothetical protein